jgi:hypothetical protein
MHGGDQRGRNVSNPCFYPVLRTAAHYLGRTACRADRPFAELLEIAVILPIFDGGNIGIRRRDMQNLMLKDTYDPWLSSYGKPDENGKA